MAKKITQIGESPIDYNQDFATEHTLILDNSQDGDVEVQQRVNVVAFKPQMDERMNERGVEPGNFIAYAGLDPNNMDEYQRKNELLEQAEDLRESAAKVGRMASGSHAFDETHKAAIEKLVSDFYASDIEARYASVRQVNQVIRAYNDHFPESPTMPLVLNEEQQKIADDFLSTIKNVNFNSPASEQILHSAIEIYQKLSTDNNALLAQQYVLPQLQAAYDSYMAIPNIPEASRTSMENAFSSLNTNVPEAGKLDKEFLPQLGEIAGAKVIQDQIDSYAPSKITPSQLQQLVEQYSQESPEVKQKLYNDMATLTYMAMESRPGEAWGTVSNDLYDAYEKSFESYPRQVQDFVRDCHEMTVDYDNAQAKADELAKIYGSMTTQEQQAVYGSISEAMEKLESKEEIKTVTTLTKEDKKVDLSQIPGIKEFEQLSPEEQKKYIDQALEHFKPTGNIATQINEQLQFLQANHPEAYAEIESNILSKNFRVFRDGEFVSNSKNAAEAYWGQIQDVAASHGVTLGGEFHELQRIKSEAENNNGAYDISSLSTIRDYIVQQYQQDAQLQREIAIEEARERHKAAIEQHMADGKTLHSVMQVAHNMESTTARTMPTGLDYIDAKWDSLTDAQKTFVAGRYLERLELTSLSATHENSGVFITCFVKNGESSEKIDLKIDKVIDENHFICLNQNNQQVLVMTETPVPLDKFSKNDVTSVLDGKPIKMPESFDSAVSFSLNDGKLMVDVPQPTSGKFDAKYEPNAEDVRSYEVLSLRQDGERSVMVLRDVENDNLVKVSSMRSRDSIEESVGAAMSFSNDGQSVSFSQKHDIENEAAMFSVIHQNTASVTAYVRTHLDESLVTNEHSVEVTTDKFARNASNQLVINHDGQEFVVDKLNPASNLVISAESPSGENINFFVGGPPHAYWDELSNVLKTSVKEIDVSDTTPRIGWEPTDGSDVRTYTNRNDLTITYQYEREDVTGHIVGITPENNGMTKITAIDLETGQQSIVHTQIPYHDAYNAYSQALQIGMEQRPSSLENISFAEKDGRVVLNADKEYQIMSITHTTDACKVIAAYNDHIVQFDFNSNDYKQIVDQIKATGLSSIQYAEVPSEKEPLTTSYVDDKDVLLNKMGVEIDSRGSEHRVSSVGDSGELAKAEIRFLHLTHNIESQTVDLQMSAVNGNERTAYNIQGLTYDELRTFIENSNLHRDAPENVQEAFATRAGNNQQQQIETICSYINSQQSYEMSSVHTHVEPGDLIRVRLEEKNFGTKENPDIHTVLRGTAYDNSQITITDPQLMRGNDGGLYVFGNNKEMGECYRIYSAEFGQFQAIQKAMESDFSWQHLGVKNYVDKVEFVHTAEPELKQTMWNDETKLKHVEKIEDLFFERSGVICTKNNGELEQININSGTLVAKEYGFMATIDPEHNKMNITYFTPDAIESKLKLEPSTLSIGEIPTSEEAARKAGFACVDYNNGIAIKNDGEVFKMREQDVRAIFADQEPPSFSSPGVKMEADVRSLTAADLPKSVDNDHGFVLIGADAREKGFVMIDFDNGVAIKTDGRCYTVSQEEIDKAYPNGRPPMNFVDTNVTQNLIELQSNSRFVAPEEFNGSKQADVIPTLNQWSISGYPPKLFYNESAFGSDTTIPQTKVDGLEIQSITSFSEKGKPSEIVVTLREPITNDGNSTSTVSQIRLGMPTEEQLATMEKLTERTAGGASARLQHYFDQVNEACVDKSAAQTFKQKNHISVDIAKYCIVHDADSDVGRLYEIIDKQGTMVAVGNPSSSEAYSMIYRNGNANGFSTTIIEPDSDIHKYAERLAQQGKGVYAEIRNDGEAVRIGNLDLAKDDDGTRHVNGMTVSARFEDLDSAIEAQREEDSKGIDGPSHDE